VQQRYTTTVSRIPLLQILSDSGSIEFLNAALLRFKFLQLPSMQFPREIINVWGIGDCEQVGYRHGIVPFRRVAGTFVSFV
jgi:hypothetical protein